MIVFLLKEISLILIYSDIDFLTSSLFHHRMDDLLLIIF